MANRKSLQNKQWRDLRLRILKRDEYTCRYCGGRADSVDHIVPRNVWPEGQPGVNDPTNLVAACIPCNSRKRDRVGVVKPMNTVRRREW